jgi:hypothetical protein
MYVMYGMAMADYGHGRFCIMMLSLKAMSYHYQHNKMSFQCHSL